MGGSVSVVAGLDGHTQAVADLGSVATYAPGGESITTSGAVSTRARRASYAEDMVKISMQRALEGEGQSTHLTLNELLSIKEYVLRAYKEDLSGKEPQAASRVLQAATAFITFLLDITDMERLPESRLKDIRADAIVAKYLVTEGVCKLPVRRTLIEATLYIMESEKIHAAKAMQAIKGEAMVFVNSEVVPVWEANTGPLGRASSCSSDATQSLLPSGRKSSAEARQLLPEFLADIDQRAVLKDYTLRKNLPAATNLLYFYMEMTDVKAMRTALLARASAADILHEGEVEDSAKLIFGRLSKIYERHLFIGSPVRTLMTAEELIDMVGAGDDLSTVKDTLIDVALDRAREIMFGIATEFLADPESLEKIAQIRERRDAKANKLKECLAPPRPQSSPRPSSPRQPSQGSLSPKQTAGQTPHDAGQSNSNEANSSYSSQLGLSRQRLLARMEGRDLAPALKHRLQVFAASNLLHYLHFWRAVQDYKSIPAVQVIFIQSRAEKIFEKYFRRGSVTEVYLPETTRDDLLGGLLFADQHVYDAAQAIAVDYLLPEFVTWEHRPLSEGGPMSQEMINDLDVFADRFSSPASPRAMDDQSKLPIPFEELLTVPAYCHFFKDFAESEFCLETVLFCGDIQESKRLPRSDLLVARMRKIHNKYVKVGASMPMRISPAARAQAVERLATNPGPTTFVMAEAEVISFLKSVLLPKFIKSRDYVRLETYLRESGRIGAPDSLRMSGGYISSTTGTSASRSNAFSTSHPSSPRSPRAPGGGQQAKEDPNNKQAQQTHKSPTGKSSNVTVLERAFKSLLTESYDVKLFYDFCSSPNINCEEYVLFYLDAEDFKNIPGVDYSRRRARKMAAQYLSDTAKNPITMPSDVKEDVLRNLDRPSPTIFVKAQESVFQRLLNNAYLQYVESPEYKRQQSFLEQYIDVGTSLSL